MVSDVIIDKLVFSYVAEKPEKDRVFMSNVKYKLKATGFSYENGETVTFRGRNFTIRFVLPTCATGSTCKENTPLEEYPAGIWCQNDVLSTSMRRYHVASTLI